MKARISLLHKTETEWLKLRNFTPQAGELIIYDPDEHNSFVRLKIGDGVNTLEKLCFFVDETVTAALESARHSELADAGRITEYF